MTDSTDSSDSLGYRKKFAILIPFTNTSVQPEFDDMRPVLAVNTAINRHALRESGITDKVAGFGPLLERH